MSKRPADSPGEAPRSSKSRLDVSSTLSPLAQQMSQLLFQERSADVHFNVGDPQKGPTERIPAIVAILCTASDVFETQFFGNFERPKEVDVPDSDPDTFRVVLRYIYTHETRLDLDNVIGTLYLAKKYMLKPLVDAAALYIDEHLTAENVCLFLDAADVLDDIKKKCWELIDSKTPQVIRSEAFLQLSQAQLGDIVKRDTMLVEEIKLFGRVVQWARIRLERSHEDPTPAAIRESLGDVLFSIRFPLMSAADFGNEMAKSRVLTAEEVIEVFFWLTIGKKPTSFSCEPRGIQLYLKSGDWCARDLYVTVRRTYEDRNVGQLLQDKRGMIDNVMDARCLVYIHELDKHHVIPRQCLVPVKPDVDDLARIIYGDGVGRIGIVVSLDGTEAVVRLSSGEKVIPINYLCKAY